MSRLRLIALLLALITLIVYLPAAREAFSSLDDPKHVTDNKVVQSGLTWVGVKWAFTAMRGGFWHPLTWLSHMLDCELFGLNSGAQHYVNVLFHTANAVLLMWLLFRLTGALWSSALVAALFAWHPLHVQSVAWLSERKDVLYMFFEMLALLAYAKAIKGGWSQQAGARELNRLPVACFALPFYWLAVVCFALALMAKPMCVTLPFVLLLLDFWPLQRTGDISFCRRTFSTGLRLALEKWPFFLLSAASSVVAVIAERSAGMTVTLAQVPLSLRLGNALLSYVRCLGKTIWPANLTVLYPLPLQLPLSGVIGAFMGLLLVTGLVWSLRRQCPYLLVGWFWYLGTLVPVIGLVQLNFQALGDHYTYVPLIGIFIGVAFGFKELIARFHIGVLFSAIAISLVLGGCLILTERQLGYWRNDEALFRHAVAVNGQYGGPHLNLGVVYFEQGRRVDALEQFQAAARLAPKSAIAHIFFARVLAETGKTDEALSQCREAQQVLTQNSEQPLLRFQLGSVLMQMGHYDEALNQFEQATRLNPDNPSLYYKAGLLLLLKNRDTDAVASIRQALLLDPNHSSALLLLADLLASDDNPQIRNGAEAVTLAEKANALTGGLQPAALDVLAKAYAENGRFRDAQQSEHRAIRLAAAAGSDTNGMNARLELYQSSKPFHQRQSEHVVAE